MLPTHSLPNTLCILSHSIHQFSPQHFQRVGINPPDCFFKHFKNLSCSTARKITVIHCFSPFCAQEQFAPVALRPIALYKRATVRELLLSLFTKERRERFVRFRFPRRTKEQSPNPGKYGLRPLHRWISTLRYSSLGRFLNFYLLTGALDQDRIKYFICLSCLLSLWNWFFKIFVHYERNWRKILIS